jgi:hypothetical protein
MQLWPDTKLVHGKARHSESQGSVERLNRTVQEKLGKWMIEAKSRAWSVGAKVVKWQINSSYAYSIRMSPYYATFGQQPTSNLSHLPMSRELMTSLSTEAQLCAAFSQPEDMPFDMNAIQKRVQAAASQAGVAVDEHGVEEAQLSQTPPATSLPEEPPRATPLPEEPYARANAENPDPKDPQAPAHNDHDVDDDPPELPFAYDTTRIIPIGESRQ